MLTQESITRKEFLKSLGLGGAALMAVITSCQNADSVAPSGSIDLASKLLTVNSFEYLGNVIVARIATGNASASFVALSKVCTHEGTTVVFQSNGKIHCPNHGAEFNTSGAVTLGPATKALTKYTVAITGTTLTVS